MKTCTKCGVTKQFSDFNTRKDSKCGLRSHCRECCSTHLKSYDLQNRERKQKYEKQWYQNNKAYKAAAEKKHMVSDPLFKLSRNIRCLIRNSFTNQGWTKSSDTQSILGCDFKTLETHLIQSALRRYGYWADFQEYHIDHITPVSTATTGAELITLNHYTNLQLLTPQDNLKKSNKLDWK